VFEDAPSSVATQRAKRRRRCKFGSWVQTLSAKDQTAAEALLADRQYSAKELATYLASKGLTVDHQVLQRHRSGTCCRTE
jgi:hypothetical protein